MREAQHDGGVVLVVIRLAKQTSSIAATKSAEAVSTPISTSLSMDRVIAGF